MEAKRKLSGKEKFAYGIGAVGKDMVYMLSASYILYYYQDIMGVSAWIMGIILLIARVFDAFNDPIMGVLVAKTKTKWGKFRPWLFIGTLTNAIILFVMFAAPPSLSGGGLAAYAAIFYILWGVTYTMMDIPYWSMVPAFTEGGKEREGLSQLARSCAGVGSAIITIITVMAVSTIGTYFSSSIGDNQTINVSEKLSAYVVETDNAGAPTGNVRSFDTAEIKSNLLITANSVEFGNTIAYNQDNSDYEVTVNGSVFNNDNSRLDFAMDSAEGKAVLVLYAAKEQYADIEGGAYTVTAEITSTKEVERLGFKYFSLIIAVLFFAFILITCVCIKEKSTVDVKTPGIGEMFKALLQNDQAMAMVIAIVLVNSATYITSNLLIYFFKYDLAGADWEAKYTLFNTFGGGIQIIAMIIFFPILRKFFTAMKTFYICIASAIGGYIILLVMALGGISDVYPFLVPGFFMKAAVGILNVLVTVFLANTVDYGELKNGRRDESVIFSMQTFVVKLASGIAALIASICLSVFNISSADKTYSALNGSLVNGLMDYVEKIKINVSTSVSGSSVVGLRLTMTLAPIIVLLIAVAVFKKKYILTDEKLEDISAELAARKRE